jgi:hypothetical protein
MRDESTESQREEGENMASNAEEISTWRGLRTTAAVFPDSPEKE